MDNKTIKAYIKKNSNPNSRSNAIYVFSKLTKTLENHFQYQCEGNTAPFEYDIVITYNNNEISTSCTCPYKKSYTGICKHVIPSFELLIKFLERF